MTITNVSHEITYVEVLEVVEQIIYYDYNTLEYHYCCMCKKQIKLQSIPL